MLRQRILSGSAMLLALLAATFWLPAIGIGLLIMALGLLALIEYSRMLRHAGIPVFTRTLAGGAILLTTAVMLDHGAGAAADAASFSWELGVLTLAVPAIMALAMWRAATLASLTSAAFSILGLLYLPLLLNFYLRLALIDFSGDSGMQYSGRILALFPIVIVKVSDMGAYFAGRRFGRHKLCPQLSPGKTREGLAGGIAAAIVMAVVFAMAFPPPAAWAVLWRPLPLAACAIVLTLVGVMGDLAESFLKRASGVKDSSGILPGMGGLLDVLDSLLFAAPVFFIFVRITS